MIHDPQYVHALEERIRQQKDSINVLAQYAEEQRKEADWWKSHYDTLRNLYIPSIVPFTKSGLP